MRETMGPALFLLWLPVCLAQTAPAGWNVLKDSRGLCQISIPPEWTPLETSRGGAAVFRDSTTAIAVVTSQPLQGFKPLSASLQKALDIRKELVFENTPKRVFYQDRTSRDAESPSAYSVSVPGREGTCSCHVTFLPGVAAETVRRIALSLGAVPE